MAAWLHTWLHVEVKKGNVSSNIQSSLVDSVPSGQRPDLIPASASASSHPIVVPVAIVLFSTEGSSSLGCSLHIRVVPQSSRTVNAAWREKCREEFDKR